MSGYIIDLTEVDREHVSTVGGKAAQLGELMQVDDIAIPAGFCVTTDAYQHTIENETFISDQLDALTQLDSSDTVSIQRISLAVREAVGGAAIPHDVVTQISDALAGLGRRATYAVRSSATAEDLPQASFAGQQETFLNVTGEAVLEHIRRCWASLFTERAVAYRLHNGFGHHRVRMAVIVQQLVTPLAAGVLFTADPVTCNRKVTSVEASFGLGEAVVSGVVNPDVYKVRDNEIVDKIVSLKQVAVVPASDGGVTQVDVTADRRGQPALSAEQVLRLVRLGRKIEAHFGEPQDIEWCLVDDDFQIVQSRPITTLFPIPESEAGNRVFVSVGHQQMMTDPMKPLGLSVWRLISRAPMREAGGRLFVDVTQALSSPTGREGLIGALGKSDPLIGDALRTITDRGFVETHADDAAKAPPPHPPAPAEPDPAIVAELIERTRSSIAAVERDIRSKSGSELFDFILADITRLQAELFTPENLQAITAGIDAQFWLSEHLESWLGERNAADTLTQSAPDNVTSEMGLALLDVADVIRPYPEVVRFLRHVEDDDFLSELAQLPGGDAARDAICGFLDSYGMRCIGEIDLTRPRWSESPTTLLPMLLANITNFETGEATRRFERGLAEASRKEQEILARLRTLPDGESKAAETKRMIDRVRAFIGYREYPKYGLVCRTFAYKKALLGEADRLVTAGVLDEPGDIFFLTFQELQEAVGSQRADKRLIDRCKDAFRSYHAMTPPRVMTSEGEAVTGTYRDRELPPGALIGLAVSSGTVEGRARIILDMVDADLEPGDILVTRHTDPSWSPLFVAVSGLVTEVGGTMTHGSVIAREYGLPAVVGVEDATRLIRDGQRIRVNGTTGYVEILSE